MEAIVRGETNQVQPKITVKEMRENSASESTIQQGCIKAFRLQFPRLAEQGALFHIPNEGIRKGRSGGKAVGEGLVKGVTDLMLSVPSKGYGGLFIEMKRPGCYPRPEQREWMKHAAQRGYKCAVCHSVVEFMKEVKEYLL